MKCNVYLCRDSDIDVPLTVNLASAIKRISSDKCSVTISSTGNLCNVDIVVLALPKLIWAIPLHKCSEDMLHFIKTATAHNKPVFILYRRSVDNTVCIYESFINNGVISGRTASGMDNISFCREVDKTISKLKEQASQNSKSCEIKPVSEKSLYDERILLLIE